MGRRAKYVPGKFRRVFVHPEFIRHFGHMSADDGVSVQEHLHETLCIALKKPQLSGKGHMRRLQAASA